MKHIVMKSFVITSLLFVFFACNIKINANVEVKDKKVLVLFAYDYGLPTVDLFLRPMHEQLLVNGIKPENIYLEFLDLNRNSSDFFKQNLVQHLEQKYEDIEFNIIVASTLDDAKFMATYGENISLAAPLIIAGYDIDEIFEGSSRKLIKMTTELLINENVALALNLFPNTRNVFIVSGSDEISKIFDRLFKTNIRDNYPDINITDSMDMSFENMLTHIRTLSSETIVFFTTYFQDKDGQNFVPKDVANEVSKNSAVAIFGVRDVHVYQGNLSAGIVYDTKEQGIQVADIVNDYFQGNILLNSEDLEIEVSPTTIINWERLTVYGANLDYIPKDATILNYVPTFWEEHRQILLQLYAVIGVLAIFGAITSYLLLKNRRINKRFNIIGTNTKTFTWETDSIGKLRYLSKQVATVLRKDKISLKETDSIITLIDPFNENKLKQKFTKMIDGTQTELIITNRHIDASNNTIVLSTIIEPVFNYKRYIKGFLGATQDITDKINAEIQIKSTKEQLSQSEKRYRLVSQVSNTGVWEFSSKQNYLWCSPEYYTMLGLNPKDFKNGPNNLKIAWTDLIHPEDRDRAQRTFAKYLDEKPDSIYENTFRLKTAKGNYSWIWSRGNFILDNEDHAADIVIGTHIDITEKKQKEEEIKYISNHDVLTSLPNRNYYLSMINLYDNIQYYPLGLIMMDINGLKLINDSFGVEAGNIALKQVADILLKQKNEQDFVARISGDEFVMLKPKTTLDEIEQLKKRILMEVSKRRVKGIGYSVAVGFEIKESSYQDITELLMKAENAMYKNKIVYGQGIRSEAIESVFSTLTNKYAYEKVHSETVAKYCRLIGEQLNLQEDDLNELELAGRLHDIGKIAIDDSIIMKEGKLNEVEWEKVKEHTVIGYQILRAADKYSDLAEHALSHHERWDGKGYPNGIKNEDIPLFSRIISVADAYEAMTSDRTYRKALTKEIAISELIKHSGTQFDPTIINVLINEVLLKNSND